MTDKFMQISIDGASYHIPLQPFDPNDPALHVSLKPGSGPAEFRLPIFANGLWFQIPLWPVTWVFPPSPTAQSMALITGRRRAVSGLRLRRRLTNSF